MKRRIKLGIHQYEPEGPTLLTHESCDMTEQKLRCSETKKAFLDLDSNLKYRISLPFRQEASTMLNGLKLVQGGHRLKYQESFQL